MMMALRLFVRLVFFCSLFSPPHSFKFVLVSVTHMHVQMHIIKTNGGGKGDCLAVVRPSDGQRDNTHTHTDAFANMAQFYCQKSVPSFSSSSHARDFKRRHKIPNPDVHHVAYVNLDSASSQQTKARDEKMRQ
jgi:hypothetical protein